MKYQKKRNGFPNINCINILLIMVISMPVIVEVVTGMYIAKT